MILVEDLSDILPRRQCGKIVGIATYRGEYMVVACEHGLYRLYEDGTGSFALVRTAVPTPAAQSEGGKP